MALPDESTYRKQVDDTFQVIDAAFEDVDPDLVESSYSQGTLTLKSPRRPAGGRPGPPR